MSNERDELAKILGRDDLYNDSGCCDWIVVDSAAEAILAAGYRKLRTVTTAEELDALPVGSVVLDNIGDAWTKTDVDFWQCFQTFNDSSGLALCGPLTVLHEAVAR
jgi:hypothetical protein